MYKASTVAAAGYLAVAGLFFAHRIHVCECVGRRRHRAVPGLVRRRAARA